ncbi:glycosyltransferase [Paracoccus sp. Ld10]|uniref:glycosyltransferase n=1 Tax=Paracoccus sp. Ld10 TaxID=649158 RepID=UPI00386333DC
MARALSYLAGLSQTSIAGRLRLLALIPSAADLVQDAQDNDVSHLHIHSCANAAHLGALAAILGGLTYSLTLHGDLPVYGTDHAAKMARASFVAAVTRPLAQQIADVSPTTPNPVIWMGVDCTRFAPSDRPAGGQFIVATVARLNHMKGHRFFLQAMAQLREQGIIITYRIAGDGPERDAITAEIDRLKLQDQVQLLGSLDESRVLALLQEVDALALSSFGQGEAAPVTVMEAMACGLPVICSRIGGTGDMIRDGVDGFLIPQEDVDAIADRLSRLQSNAKFADMVGKAARQTALASFDCRRNARLLLSQITGIRGRT